MTTFDKAAYDESLDDIETYLGYLKGNELIHTYFMRVTEKAQTRPFQFVEGEYTTPCPDPAFSFQPRYAVPIRDGGSTQIDLDIEAKILAGADAAWRQGPTWASGIAGQARAITEQITSPDVAELETALKTLDDEVLLPLQLLLDSNADIPEPYRIPLPEGDSSVDGDWANLSGLVNSWHGTAAGEFRTLYDNLGVTIGMYAYFAGAAALEVAAATTIIGAAQRGLLISVKDIRETLLAQLDKWQAVKQPPSDGSTAPTWILDLLPITKVYKGARLVIKSVTDPKTINRTLVDIKRTITGKSATEMIEGQGEEQPFEAADSEEVLSSLTRMLRETYLRDFVDALSDLSASPGGSLAFLHDLQDKGMWAPPTVSAGSVRGSGDRYRA